VVKTTYAQQHAAMKALLSQLSQEQNRAIEHVLVDRAFALHPLLRQLSGEALLELRLDLVCEQVNEQLRSVSLDQDAWLEKPSVAQKHYFALPGVNHLRARFGDAPLAWWRLAHIAPTLSSRGLPPTEQLCHGEPITIRINDRWMSGAYLGFDWLGRLVLRVLSNGRTWQETGYWEDARVLRPSAWSTTSPTTQEQRAFIVGLYPEVTCAASPLVAGMLEKAVHRPALGDLRVIDYMQAVWHEGFELMLHGGCVRDTMRLATTNPNATPAALIHAIKDVDFVCTAPIPELRRIAADLGVNYVNAGVVTSMAHAQNGVLRIAPSMGEEDTAGGFDAACLRLSGINSGTRYNPITGDVLVPAVFSNHLETDAWWKDMTMNTLFARRSEAGAWSLIDPMGQAVKDTMNKWLRLPRLSREHAVNSLRFWKFRMRGYRSDRASRQKMRVHAETLWPRLGRVRLATLVLPIALPYVGEDRRFSAFFAAIRPPMIADGCKDLLERFIDTDWMRRELRRLYFEGMNPL
jgi:hypothetical protein